MCGPERVPFRPFKFTNGLFFYLKLGLEIGRVFAKCLIFDEFFFWFTYRLHGKITDWLKKGPFKKQMVKTKVTNFRLL